MVYRAAYDRHHGVAKKFTGGISVKYRSATVKSVDQLEALPPTLTHLTFGGDFDQPLDNVTLPPKLTRLTFGHWFNQPFHNVRLPPALMQSDAATNAEAFDVR